jgi:hypothetical protein
VALCSVSVFTSVGGRTRGVMFCNVIHVGRWAYTCVDVLALVSSAQSSASQFRLRRVDIYGSSTEDVFIDTVFIGRDATTDDLGELPWTPRTTSVSTMDTTDALGELPWIPRTIYVGYHGHH